MVIVDHGLSGSLRDNAIVVRDMLMRSIFPQLRVGLARTAAVERVLRDQPISGVHQFPQITQRDELTQYSYMGGVVECIAVPEGDMSSFQQSKSFRV